MDKFSDSGMKKTALQANARQFLILEFDGFYELELNIKSIGIIIITSGHIYIRTLDDEDVSTIIH